MSDIGFVVLLEDSHLRAESPTTAAARGSMVVPVIAVECEGRPVPRHQQGSNEHRHHGKQHRQERPDEARKRIVVVVLPRSPHHVLSVLPSVHEDGTHDAEQEEHRDQPFDRGPAEEEEEREAAADANEAGPRGVAAGRLGGTVRTRRGAERLCLPRRRRRRLSARGGIGGEVRRSC